MIFVTSCIAPAEIRRLRWSGWMEATEADGHRSPSRSMEGRGICYVTNKDNNIPFDRLNARAAGRASQRQMGAKIASNWFTPSNNSINRETLQLKGLCYDSTILRYVCYMQVTTFELAQNLLLTLYSARFSSTGKHLCNARSSSKYRSTKDFAF